MSKSPRAMSKAPKHIRTFSLTLTATVKLDPKVIDQVSDEWREHFYDLESPEDIAEMVGLALLRGSRLSQLDGWADLDDSLAKVDDVEVEYVVEDE